MTISHWSGTMWLFFPVCCTFYAELEIYYYYLMSWMNHWIMCRGWGRFIFRAWQWSIWSLIVIFFPTHPDISQLNIKYYMKVSDTTFQPNIIQIHTVSFTNFYTRMFLAPPLCKSETIIRSKYLMNWGDIQIL